MTDPVLHLDRVSGGIVRDVTLDVRAGEVVGLVGSAGTGKTTLLQLAAGWRRPSAGTTTIGGHVATTIAARRLVGYAQASPAFPPGLTVRGVLEYYAWFHGPAAARRALVAATLELADLGAVAGERPARLPQGVLRRVSLAQAVLGGRRVLLLDETLEGSDAATRRALIERLGRLAWNGAAIVLASHDLDSIQRFADRIVVLRAGTIVRDQPAAVLLRERVLEVVLDAPPAAPPPGFRLAPFGVEADLGPRTVEAALALCRAHRLVVRATRVRSRSLEDVVVESSGRS
jgi:ABC-type multidrug transport system ATPase subunit